MAQLDELKVGALVQGLLPGNSPVTLLGVTAYADVGVEVVYKDINGHLGSELLYLDAIAHLQVAPKELPWRFDANGALFRLVSEAYRIRLAYLFDPLIAVHTSQVEPLPHQITAVYETMLGKQPLRYLLADDPGAGKTIMAGLLIKELMIRGDLHRCLIVSPGNLVEQWQDELLRRFHLVFEILTNDRIESSASGNPFLEMPLYIARLDKLSRDEHARGKLQQTEWDLVVVDEAHKMSATFFSGEVKFTKRYQLGQMLGGLTRYLVLLTATPHNGKEEDFQLFLALLDQDRFEGRFRDGVHKVDVSDIMRHLVKEQLYKFDSTPLFPERLAYTVQYQLSPLEDELYRAVTTYVRQEFNRADALQNNGRKGTIGFALTTLQRRLASSPEAIYQSLRHRRERLQQRLQESNNSIDKCMNTFYYVFMDNVYSPKEFGKLIWVMKLRDGEKWPGVYTAKKTLKESRLHDPELNAIYNKLLQDVFFRLGAAMDAFFRRVKNGEKPGFPRVRPRHCFFTLCYPGCYLTIENGVLILPTGGKGKNKKYPDVRAKLTEEPPTEFGEVAISRDARGNYYACFSQKIQEIDPTPGKVVAFDLGIKTLAVGTNEQGRVYHIGGFKGSRWYNKQLDKIRSKRDRCKKKSRRYKHLSKVYKRVSEKKRNKQRDSLHKASHLISRRLVERTVVVGDLSQRQMATREHHEKNKQRNRAVYNDWGLYTFIMMLTYKCQLYGKELVILDESYTSKTCSGCGNKQDMPLWKRTYCCTKCGLVMDRDENSAVNILTRYLARLGPHTHDECGVLHTNQNSVEVVEASCPIQVQQLRLW